MPTGDFEKTSWGWQVAQLQQQVGEWVELQLSRLKLPWPNWSPSTDPAWLKVVWLLLSLLAIWLGWQLWRQFSPAFYTWLAQARTTQAATTSVSELSIAEWLQRSQTYFRQGNYREACRYLYLAMLQRLNDNGTALHQPSRTDGEYWQLVQQLHDSESYQTLIATHEQLCFSEAEISPETFARAQQAYQEISGE